LEIEQALYGFRAPEEANMVRVRTRIPSPWSICIKRFVLFLVLDLTLTLTLTLNMISVLSSHAGVGCDTFPRQF